MSKKSPLPKLVMLPINGEYKIIPLPRKQTLLESVLRFAAIWITLILCGSFCFHIIYITNVRLP